MKSAGIEVVTFDKIKNGACFLYDGKPYVKTAPILLAADREGIQYNAVGVEHTDIARFEVVDGVVILSATMAFA